MSSVSIHNLSVTHLSKGEKVEALNNISLEINEGEIYSIMGPSGSGKSTLLHVLGGIIKEYQGEVLIDGKKPDPMLLSMGLVPQNYGLLPWKRVKENIFLPVKIKNIHTDEEENREILNTLDLENILHRYPHELSGGQQQRVALARAFIQKPDLLLMDEPFSALDTITAEKCRDLFLKVWKRHKVTTLFVTHSLDEAVIMGKHLIFLSKAPGEILRIVDNPLMAPGANRSPEAYFELAQQLREQINKEWI